MTNPLTLGHLPHVTTRRQLLQAGSIGLLGLGMADLAALRVRAAGASESSQRSVIFVFLTGGPSQHDTFDMKPDGPSEYRGEFSPIATKTPGIQICEHFPLLAQQSHHWSLVRSLTHNDNGHQTGTYIMLTGRQDTSPFRFGKPHANDWPSIAAVAGAVSQQRNNLPRSMVLPEKVWHSQQGTFPGQFAGLTGTTSKADPMRYITPTRFADCSRNFNCGVLNREESQTQAKREFTPRLRSASQLLMACI